MIVIVEGVDGSGKSTLVKQLAESGYMTTSIESSKDGEFHQWNSLLCGEVVITDRSFLSDLVYRVNDGKPRRGMDLYYMSLLLCDEVKIIFCETGTEFEDSMERGEDNVCTINQSKDLKNIYRVVREIVRLFTDAKVFVYNWHEMTVSDVIKFIEERR